MYNHAMMYRLVMSQIIRDFVHMIDSLFVTYLHHKTVVEYNE